jgi:CRISPR-associated protein Cmr1
MRTAPEAPKEIKKRANAQSVIQERKYELITPMFGGGVEPGHADPVTVIRGTEIRGHLRFWWRATRGGEFDGSLSVMKDAEDLLWGAASSEDKPRPSQVHVVVEVAQQHRGEPMGAHESSPVYEMRSPYGYVAFPLRESQGDLLKSVKFTLSIRFPEVFKADVEAALWAWEMFGGIGARTRRGCGALCLLSVDNVAAQQFPEDAGVIKKTITEQLAGFVSAGTWPGGVPHLSRSLEFKVTNPAPSPMHAWRSLIAALKSFRQQRNAGSAPNRPGRSKWPEPDAIRRLTSAAEEHATPLSSIDKFPRAAFGLPIIFKFKDDKIGDPPQTTLRGAGSDRLASRLVLRPLACGGEQGVGLAIILDPPSMPPGGLVLDGAPRNPSVQSDLTVAEAATIAPLSHPAPPEPDVLKALLRTL